jgi:hypothetical protein
MSDFQLDGQAPCFRNPRDFPWGYYLAWSLGAGAAQGFHWFSTEEEAVASLLAMDDALFPHPLPEQPDDQPVTLAWLMAGGHRLADLPVDRINASQCVAMLRWAGHRDALLSSGSRFAREIRRDFIDHWEDAHHVPQPLGQFAPLFHRHLLAYAERFREHRYVSPYRLPSAEALP